MDKVRTRVVELKQAINDTVDDTKKGKTVMSRAYRAVRGSVKVATKGYKVIFFSRSVFPFHPSRPNIFSVLCIRLFEGRPASFPEARSRFRSA